MLTDWKHSVDGGHCWLLNAAGYLMYTDGVRWAVDPAYGPHIMPTPELAGDDLSNLDLVLLTHTHSDHFDLTLLMSVIISFHRCRNFPGWTGSLHMFGWGAARPCVRIKNG